MKFKKVSLIFFVCAIFMCLPFCFFVKNKPVYAEVAGVESYYLFDGTTGYKSNVVAGSTTGYNKFKVGEENVTLTATPNTGFKVVGWQVHYCEQEKLDEFITSGVYSTTDEQGNVVTFTISFGETSSFKINRIFEELQVEPVFDYIYYNVDLTSLLNESGVAGNMLDGLNTETIGTVTLYTETDIADGILQNCFALEENKFYYVEDVKKEGNNYYICQPKNDGTEDVLKTPFSVNAFRFNQQIEFNVKTDLTSDLNTSKNFIITGVKVNNTSIEEKREGVTTWFENVLDENQRTTRINLNLQVTEDSVVDITKNDYNIVTLQIMLDGIDFTNIIDYVNVTVGAQNYEHLYFDGTQYFTDVQDKGSTTVSITDDFKSEYCFDYTTTATQNIKSNLIKYDGDKNSYLIKNAGTITVTAKNDLTSQFEGDENIYTYFKLNTLKVGGREVDASYGPVHENITLQANYSSAKFDVEYKFALYDDEVFKNVSGEFNVPEKEENKTRGESLIKPSEQTNVGYTFVGYYINNEFVEENIFAYTISYQKPKNDVIYLCYTTNLYSLNIVDDAKTLKNNGTTINPVKEVNWGEKTIVGLANQFTETLKIGDILTLNVELNSGFELDKIVIFAESKEDVEVDSTELTAEIIADYITGNRLNVKIKTNYVLHTLTYSINEVGSAQISIENADDFEVTYYNGSDEEIELLGNENDVAKIEVINLKLYQNVTLLSRATNSAYVIINFKYNNAYCGYTSTEDAGTMVYSYTKQMPLNDVEIEVLFTSKTNILTIGVNGLGDEGVVSQVYTVKQNNVVLSADDEEYTIEQSEGPVSISVNVQLKPGYQLKKYTLNGTENNLLGLTITIPNPNKAYMVVMIVEYVTYTYDVYYKTTGNAELISENNSFSLASPQFVEVEKPEGYYVKTVTFGGSLTNANNEISSMKQSNEDKNNNNSFKFYNHDFTSSDIQTLTGKVSATHFVFVLNYQLFTYKVKISFIMSGYTLSDILGEQYPVVKYSFDEINNQIECDKETSSVEIMGIPYNSQAKFTVENLKPGVECSGWQGVSGYEYDNKKLIISALTKDETSIIYNLQLATYNLNIKDNYNNLQGEVTSYVNNKLNAQIQLNNKLKLVVEAKKSNGYTYDCVFVEAKCTESTWTSELFKKQGNKFVPSTQYVSGTKFYKCLEIKTIGTENAVTIEKFNPEDFVVEAGNKIQIYPQFKLIPILLTHTNKNESNETSITLDYVQAGSGYKASVKITPDEYTNFKVYKRAKATDEWQEIALTDAVTFGDLIKVDVILKQYQVEETVGGKEEIVTYNLSDGVILKTINAGQHVFYKTSTDRKTFNLNLNPDLTYSLTFSVDENVMADIDNENCLTINYKYELKHSNITVSTNVPSSATDFYDNISITLNWGSNQSSTQASHAASLSQKVNFLQSWNASYNLNYASQKYGNYFCVNAIEFTLPNTSKIKFQIVNEWDKEKQEEYYADIRAQLKNYGIFVSLSDEQKDTQISGVTIRVLGDIGVKFIVQPIIKIKNQNGEFENYNANLTYSTQRVFKCDNKGQGAKQTLTAGDGNAVDIQALKEICDLMEIKYFYNTDLSTPVEMTNVGTYCVKITFLNSGDFGAILQNMEIVLYVEILPLQIKVGINSTTIPKISKQYNGTSDIATSEITKYLNITNVSGSTVKINYLDADCKFKLKFNSVCSIVEHGTERLATSVTEENYFYDLLLNNISLNMDAGISSDFNKNFELVNNKIVFNNLVKVTPKNLKLYNLTAENVYDKVFDRTDVVYLANKDQIKIDKDKICLLDDVQLDVDLIKVKFKTFDEPGVHTITVDATEALVGASARNYVIENSEYEITGKTIYPYKLTAKVETIGEITLENRDGLNNPTDMSKVNLILLNSQLKFKMIEPDTPTYVDLYDSTNISNYLSNKHLFAVGYQIYMLNALGKEVPISSDLYLTIPTVSNLQNVLFVTGEECGEVEYDENENHVTIKLSNLNVELDTIVLVKNRVYLQLWEIILIIAAVVVLIGTIVGVFIFVRKKKLRRYSLNEKI